MQVAVVAAARKLATLCWRLVVTGQDYAFARPSLTDKELRALELLAGLPARPDQKGKAAAYSLKEVRQGGAPARAGARRAGRGRPPSTRGRLQPKPPAKQQPKRGVAAATGARRPGPQGAKLRGSASSPMTLLFAPGSTTPNAEPNDATTGGQRHRALETFIRAPQLGPVLAGQLVEGQQLGLCDLQQPSHLGCGGLQAVDDLGQSLAGLGQAGGLED